MVPVVSVVVAGSPSDSGHFVPSLGVIPSGSPEPDPGRPRKARKTPNIGIVPGVPGVPGAG